MTSSALRVTAPPGDVNAVHDFLETVWEQTELDPMVRFKFETAMIELTSNVIKHAALDRVTFEVSLTVDDRVIEAVILDDGAAGTIEFERAMPGDLAESGRGIPLIRVLVDSVEYERVGEMNRWRIATHLSE